MNQILKKKLLALLLFICCLLSTGLLLNAGPAPEKKIKNLKQLDSLILKKLYAFGVTQGQISSYDTVIDATFKRKVFTLTVPKKFPETKLHLSLKKAFQSYHFLLPARVLFPDKDLRIHFMFKGTILRTLLIDTEEPDVPLSNMGFIYSKKRQNYSNA